MMGSIQIIRVYIEHVISTIWLLQISCVHEHVRELGKHMHEVHEHVRQFKVCFSRCLFESSHVHLKIVCEYMVLEQKLSFVNLSNANFTNTLTLGAMSGREFPIPSWRTHRQDPYSTWGSLFEDHSN